MFVIDASVALVFLLDQDGWEAAAAAVRRMADEPALAPDHWPLEIANVLIRELRRGRLELPTALALAQQVETWSVGLDPETGARALDRTMELAAAYRLTAYDAAYLELCLRLGLPLATFDADLALAASEAGVPTVLEA